MKLTGHDVAPLQDLKRQPVALMLSYILVGCSGIGLAFLLELSPVMNIIVVALSGFLIGISAEKFVTQRTRKIAYQLFKGEKQTTDQ